MPLCITHNQFYGKDEYCPYCGDPQLQIKTCTVSEASPLTLFKIYGQNPITSSAWKTEEIDNAEFGIELCKQCGEWYLVISGICHYCQPDAEVERRDR